MATFTSIKVYRRVMQKRVNAVIKGGDRSSMTVAKLVVLHAKRLAPRKSGRLIGGIRKRKRKNGHWTAESWVPGQFKYNKWVNQTTGFRTLVYKRPNQRFGLKVGDSIVYGRRPATWQWTGMPRYWDISVNKVRRQFGRITRKNTLKALRINA